MKRIVAYMPFLVLGFSLYGQKPADSYLLGSSKLLLNEPDSTVNYLSHAISADPSAVEYYLKRGEAYYMLKKFDGALGDFAKANQIKSNIANLWLAKTYARLDDKKEAIDYLKRHLESEYRQPEKAIQQDKAFDNLQFSDEWFMLWQGNWYTPEENLEKEVGYLAKKGAFIDALALVDNSLRDPSCSKPGLLYSYRADIEIQQGNFKAAAMDFTNAIEKSRTDGKLYKKRGMAYLNAGKYKEAVDDFSKTLRYDPAEFGVYILRAKAYNALDDFSAAEKDMKTYLDYFPRDMDAIALAGEFCYNNHNYIGALKYFNKNLSLDGSRPEYFKARGKTYYQIGMYKYAIDDLSMALDLYPNDGETYYFKGLSRFYSGNRSGACDDWKIAVKLGNLPAIERLIENCQ